MAKAKTRLFDVSVAEVSLVDKGANNKRFYLKKRNDSGTIVEKDSKSMDEETLKKAAADAKAEAEALKAKLEALEKSATDAKTAAEKAEADAKVAIEKAQTEKVDLEKRLVEAQEQKEIGEAIAKAATDFKNLPEKPQVLGVDLRSVRKADAALADRLEGLLKKLDALAAQSLEPKGSAKADDKEASAWDEITKRATALVTDKKSPSFAAAVDAVLKADKSLYAAHEAEKNGK